MIDSEKEQLRKDKKERGECMCLRCSAKAVIEGYCGNCYHDTDRRCT